jgi:membrane protease YdiL (CAAX protease family)
MKLIFSELRILLIRGKVDRAGYLSYYITTSPILTLPQLSLGFLLGYLRLKYGVGYSMLLHGGYNFFILLLAL